MLNLSVLENLAPNSFVADFSVTDLDIGTNGDVSFYFNGTYADRYNIN